MFRILTCVAPYHFRCTFAAFAYPICAMSHRTNSENSNRCRRDHDICLMTMSLMMTGGVFQSKGDDSTNQIVVVWP